MQMFYAEAIVVSGWESIRYREMRKMRIHHVKCICIARTSTATFSVSFHINSVKSYFDFIRKTFIFTNFSHTNPHFYKTVSVRKLMHVLWTLYYSYGSLAIFIRLSLSLLYNYLLHLSRIYFLNLGLHISMHLFCSVCMLYRIYNTVCVWMSVFFYHPRNSKLNAHTFTHVPLPPISKMFALQWIQCFSHSLPQLCVSLKLTPENLCQ